jgi:hypothetical protein
VYPSNYRHEDDTTCAYCGVETEVIGPPGPVHKPGCPHAPDPFLSKNERNLTDEESDFLFEQTIGTPVGRNLLHMGEEQGLALLRKMLDNRKKK